VRLAASRRTLRNDDLIREVEGVLQCVSLGHAARKDSGVKVRQPLRRVLVQTPSAQARTWVENWRDTILDELNVKELELLDDAGELVEYSLKANLPKLGKKLGKQMGVVRQAFEGASPEDARRIGEASRRGEEFTLRVGEEEMTFAPDEVLVQTEQKSGYQFASENGWAVALDTTLDQDLIDEAWRATLCEPFSRRARMPVSRSATASRFCWPSARTAVCRTSFEKWGDYIQNETLADELRLVPRDYPELLEAKIGDETVHFRVERLLPDELADEADLGGNI
jgi:isoleucyl-tRNA synthetase